MDVGNHRDTTKPKEELGAQLDIQSLRQNLPVTKVQSQSVKATIASQSEYRSHLQSEVAAREKKLEELRGELKELRGKQEDCDDIIFFNRAVLAPVRRIPPEVLGTIFKHSVDTVFALSIAGWDAGGPWVTPPPLLLTHICHSWRMVAQGTPALWARINIYSQQMWFNPSILHLWIRNSGALPLDITFCTPGHCGGRIKFPSLDQALHRWHTNPTYFATVKSILEQQHRIRKLRLIGPRKMIANVMGAGDSRDFPVLRDLSVECLFSTEHDPEFQQAAAMDDSHLGSATYEVATPQLHNALLSRASSLAPAITASCLRSLNLSEPIAFAKLYNILSRCFVIEVFEADSFNIILSPQTPPDPIVLSNLRYLDVQWIPDLVLDGVELLGWIQAPSLQSLRLAYCPEETDVLWQFTSHASSTLHTLELPSFINTFDGTSSHFIQTLAEIETSCFQRCAIKAEFWELLTPAEDSSPTCWIWPKLNNLEFSHEFVIPDDIEECDAAFILFVDRRAPPIPISGQSPTQTYTPLQIVLYDHFSAMKSLQVLNESRPNLEIEFVNS